MPLTIVTSLLANLVGLGLAAVVFDGFSMTWTWYVVAVVVFTAVAVGLRLLANAKASDIVRPYTILGGLALTAVGLAFTHFVVPGDGFHITGAVAWIGVTVFVWAAGVAFGEVQPTAPAATPGISPEQRAAERDGDAAS